MLGAIKVAREFRSVVTGRIRQRERERGGGNARVELLDTTETLKSA